VISARLCERLNMTFRLKDHQMNIDRLSRGAPCRLDDARAKADVGHKTAIHHVDVDPIGSARVYRPVGGS
jgi:hypothetical protein